MTNICHRTVFKDESTATRYANRKPKNRIRKRGPKKEAYRCENGCNAWHLRIVKEKKREK